MKYTSSHWGTYRLDGPGRISPLEDDPRPSRIGRGWVSAAKNTRSRILAPAVRRGWLDGDNGAGRGRDSFIEMSWKDTLQLTAQEISRVSELHGNTAIFGGSYGWSSAGRFHHAQSQLRRFLNLTGGFVSSKGTYSHAAAEVLFPHILGLSNRAFQDQMTSQKLVGENCEVLLALGGISKRTAQISASGVTRHDVDQTLHQILERRGRIINVSPRGSDMPDAEWLSIRPGTDTAFILAMSYHLVTVGKANEVFLSRCTSGWSKWRSYLDGTSDGTPKTPEWASEICDIPAKLIRDIADILASQKSMIAVNWGLQRAEHGEQVLWAALGLACILGQIGQPGTGFAFGYGSTTHVGRPARLIPWPSVPQGKNPVSDFIPVARVADMLLNPGGAYRYNGETRIYPDIRLVYWCGGNPFHHHQDLNRLEQAWRQPETVIVQDHSWTATARRADIVLPATPPLERHDIMMNRRDTSLIFMSPVIEPVGKGKSDYEIFRLLAQEMGFEQAFTEGREEIDWLRWLWTKAQDVAGAEGFSLPDFGDFQQNGRFDVPNAQEDRVALKPFVRDPHAAPLETETGKITLFNRTIEAFAAPDCPPCPTWMQPKESLLSAASDELHLISGQPDTRLHSQNDQGSEALSDKIQRREPAYLNPEVALERGLKHRDIIRLWNKRGACLAGLRLDPLMRKDCIALPTGAWFDPQMINGKVLEVHGNPNVLTQDRGCSELSQGNMAHSALVRIEKWTGTLPALSIENPPDIKTEWAKKPGAAA